MRKRFIFLSYTLHFLKSFQGSWKEDIILSILLMMKLRSSEVTWCKVCVQVFHLCTVCCVAHALSIIFSILIIKESPLSLTRRRNNSLLIVISSTDEKNNDNRYRHFMSDYSVLGIVLDVMWSQHFCKEGTVFILFWRMVNLRLRLLNDLPKVTRLLEVPVFVLLWFSLC